MLRSMSFKPLFCGSFGILVFALAFFCSLFAYSLPLTNTVLNVSKLVVVVVDDNTLEFLSFCVYDVC